MRERISIFKFPYTHRMPYVRRPLHHRSPLRGVTIAIREQISRHLAFLFHANERKRARVYSQTCLAYMEMCIGTCASTMPSNRAVLTRSVRIFTNKGTIIMPATSVRRAKLPHKKKTAYDNYICCGCRLECIVRVYFMVMAISRESFKRVSR